MIKRKRDNFENGNNQLENSSNNSSGDIGSYSAGSRSISGSGISGSSGSNNQKLTLIKFKEIDYDSVSYHELQSIAGSLYLLKNGKKEVLYSRIEKYLQDIDQLVLDSLTLKRFREIYNLDTSSHIQIQNVAKSLNISDYGSKQDVYKRIDDYLALKENIPKEIQEKDNINPFNKKRAQIKITDNLDPVELPFWSVFRNKILFKSIFSNFNSSYYHYDNVYGSYSTIQHFTNAESIIRDKVKSNSHFIKNNPDLVSIFSLIRKNTLENKEFYRQLYNSYSRNNPLNQFSNTSVWLEIIIDSGNITALEQYISQFNISKEFIRGCVQNFKITGFKSIKMFDYLKSNDYISTQKLCLLENCLYIYGESFTINQLIKTFNTISTFNSSKIKEKYNSLINQLKQHQQNQPFTDDQLKLTIREFLTNYHHQRQSNQVNLKLIRNYYKVINRIYYINNTGSFRALYTILFKSNQLIMDSFRATMAKASFNNFKDYYEVKLCVNRNQQIKSTIQLAQYMSRIFGQLNKQFIQYIISKNDLKLIDTLVKHLPSSRSVYKCSVLQTVIPSITSTQVFDYFYNHPYFKESKLNQPNYLWSLFSSIDILEHYQSLIGGFTIFISSSTGSFKYTQLKAIHRYLNNSTINNTNNSNNNNSNNSKPLSVIYQFDKNLQLEIIDSYCFTAQRNRDQDQEYINIIMDLLKAFLFRHVNLSTLLNCMPDPNKVVEWLFSYISKQDIIDSITSSNSNIMFFTLQKVGNNISVCDSSIKIDGIQDSSPNTRETTFQFKITCLLRLLTMCGRTNESFELLKTIKMQSTNLWQSLLSFDQIPASALYQMFKYLYEIDKGISNQYLAFSLINYIVRIGSLSTIKRIVSNYPTLFKNNNSGIFTTSDFNDFVATSISFGHQELTEFLINIIGLSRMDLKVLGIKQDIERNQLNICYK